MRFNHDTIFPAKGFSTPPAACLKSPNSFPAMPMSERKSNPLSGCRRDLFHVVHKVPAGDSPYGRAKHVQLIEKDPSRAISLFWAAINAGDRVDSALKDMAVVMKQLNRSDEAIEAIKSFRHLCPYESQESLDNVLVELYKRSGRIEEEIEMLHRKLKIVEEGIAFGGKRTKIARSQGKKIQITVEQERSRILGNLAWAYLQHHDYGLAENFYRKALALEPDNNKKCNLALCLMHMNRIPEAKSLLQNVKASVGTKEMDESFIKSFDRVVQTLTEIESRSAVKPTEDNDWWKLNRSKCILSDTSLPYQEQQNTPVLYTQPRNVSQTRKTYDGDENAIQNLDGKFISQPRIGRRTNYNQEHSPVISGSKSAGNSELLGSSDANVLDLMKPTGVNERKPGLVKASNHKSWADMVEEDERRLQTGENLSPCFDGWSDEEPNNENQDSNIVYQSQSSKSPASLKDKSVSCSLCFDGNKGSRLQVFREITQSR